MRQKAEKITYHGKTLAIIIRHGTPIPGTFFFTSPEAPFQIGTLSKKGGDLVKPHKHQRPVSVLREAHEVILVEKGKMKMSLYTANGTLAHETILNTGDKVLLASGGHGFEVLEDTVMFQVKQGPYPGYKNAKLYFDKHI